MNTSSNGNTLFPIFLKLQEFTTLVVGGGPVGLEKVEALLKNDPQAAILLVAPEILPELHTLSHHHPIRLVQRKFQEEDLEGIRLLILATDSRELHVSIRKLAHERQILVNVADTPDLCDFYLGSTVKKGDLKIGISTNGKSPTLAKRFREVLEDILPEETNSLLANLKEIRDDLKGDFAEKVKTLDRITASLKR
jgi:siroheme synthase-like protein